MALNVQNLSVWFDNKYSTESILDKINLNIPEEKLIAIIGKSGSGKSVLVRSIARILQGKPGIVSGTIKYNGNFLLHENYNLGSFNDNNNLTWQEKVTDSHQSRLCNELIEPTRILPNFKIRKPKIGMIFQDALEYLNPGMTLYKQISQTIDPEDTLNKSELNKKIEDVLKKVYFPDDQIQYILENKNSYKNIEPNFLLRLYKGLITYLSSNSRKHNQLSGGLRQRFSFALALSINSNLFIADEPITDLDVINAYYIKELIQKLKKNNKTIILVSHDLHMISELADHVFVMDNGKIIYHYRNEPDIINDLSKKWEYVENDYTEKLLKAYNKLYDRSYNKKQYNGNSSNKKITTEFICFSQFSNQPLSQKEINQRNDKLLLEVKDLTVSYNNIPVLNNIGLEFFKFTNVTGSNLGIIGESGAGKTTLAMAILNLIPDKNIISGKINIKLTDFNYNSRLVNLKKLDKEKICKNYRRQIQYIFQDCGQAFHPRKTLKKILEETARLSGQTKEYYQDIWSKLKLSNNDFNKKAWELSGGMKRRAYIVRAFTALSPDEKLPKIIITDEAVKGVDTVSQEEIISFFEEQSKNRNIYFINISHNLSLVRSFSDVIYIMFKGKVLEICDTNDFFENKGFCPSFFHPYSKWLKFCSKETKFLDTNDKPRLADQQRSEEYNKSNKNGCPFYPYCNFKNISEICLESFPSFYPVKDKYNSTSRYHFVACHYIPRRMSI